MNEWKKANLFSSSSLPTTFQTTNKFIRNNARAQFELLKLATVTRHALLVRRIRVSVMRIAHTKPLTKACFFFFCTRSNFEIRMIFMRNKSETRNLQVACNEFNTHFKVLKTNAIVFMTILKKDMACNCLFKRSSDWKSDTHLHTLCAVCD